MAEPELTDPPEAERPAGGGAWSTAGAVLVMAALGAVLRLLAHILFR